ncbi:6-phosphofructokinase (plasmid) [Acaryochloris sp. 'Moss Beach']|uniref:ATP-dependent 6-phosphofructokinase n=1 Tax=Acaryochloris sp. 'Moss Beach' TaxID=2740837 RepID=UPI001F26E44D|nr:ATP-dependent 6-phosphofructokinase [Acaryochloris sp. 'Moss Beach']UJB72568.1 6-phosphofructokinase [Acaryochloris sp. 'Moss Beach']
MDPAKRIGILTSGGDCPGLNAIIRAVIKCATHKGWEVFGIPYGTQGLINLELGHCTPEDLRLTEHGYDVPGLLGGLDILQFLSGSILGALNKGNPSDPAIAQEILQGFQRLNLDSLIAIGGDGSLDIIDDLAQKGQWRWVAIPKTIDNDVPFTEISLGFDTAVNTVTRSLYDLTFTAASHDRIMVVQVMGRDAGYLALHSGIAGGADVILIPELTPCLSPSVIDQVCRQIALLQQGGRRFALVVIAEGVRRPNGQKVASICEYLAQQIQVQSKTLCSSGHPQFCNLQEVDCRAIVLGHIQRSGVPTAFDRLLAARFGREAVDLISQQYFNRLVVWENGEVASKPLRNVIPRIKECHREKKCPDPVNPQGRLVQTAKELGIYIGAK